MTTPHELRPDDEVTVTITGRVAVVGHATLVLEVPGPFGYAARVAFNTTSDAVTVDAQPRPSADVIRQRQELHLHLAGTIEEPDARDRAILTVPYRDQLAAEHEALVQEAFARLALAAALEEETAAQRQAGTEAAIAAGE